MSFGRVSAFIIALCLGFWTSLAAQDSLPSHHGDDPKLDPPGFQLLLRTPQENLSYKLGEKLELQYACVSEIPGQYFADCSPEIDLVPLDYRAKTAVDLIETTWIDDVLCPGALVTCGATSMLPYYPVGTDPRWQSITIEKHYPMSAGRFTIVAFVWGTERQIGEFRATSVPIQIVVNDDAEWRAHLLQSAQQLSQDDPDAYELVSSFPDIGTMDWLVTAQGFQDTGLNYVSLQAKPAIEMHPDRGAMAELLRGRLQSELDGDSIRDEIRDILAMNVAAEKPHLYDRARKYKLSVEEKRQMRRWLLPLRRQLLLEVGESLVKNSDALRHRIQDEDSDDGPDMDDLTSKAEVLVELSIPLCPGEYSGVLTKPELRRFMLQAGFNPEFIIEQLANVPTRKKPTGTK
jgi:hypothetical protein